MVLHSAIDVFEAKNAFVRSRDSWESALCGDLFAAGAEHGATLSCLVNPFLLTDTLLPTQPNQKYIFLRHFFYYNSSHISASWYFFLFLLHPCCRSIFTD